MNVKFTRTARKLMDIHCFLKFKHISKAKQSVTDF